MVSLPITSFSFQRPPDGLPLLHSWLATLKAITFEGFETWRGVGDQSPDACFGELRHQGRSVGESCEGHWPGHHPAVRCALHVPLPTREDGAGSCSRGRLRQARGKVLETHRRIKASPFLEADLNIKKGDGYDVTVALFPEPDARPISCRNIDSVKNEK